MYIKCRIEGKNRITYLCIATYMNCTCDMYICMYILIDLITMENGIKVSPFEIEDCIKSEIPFLSNIMLIGHKRKYLTCLMTLKVRNKIFNQ